MLPLAKREFAVPQSPPTAAATRNDSWENEGGSVASLSHPEPLGIKRMTTETYSVGGYRYTSLADAVAQARRMTTLERGPESRP